jgi:hypothetical protein
MRNISFIKLGAMPRGDQAFLVWSMDFLQHAKEYAEELGLNVQELATLEEPLGVYRAALVKAQSQFGNSIDKARKTRLKEELRLRLGNYIKTRLQTLTDLDEEYVVGLGFSTSSASASGLSGWIPDVSSIKSHPGKVSITLVDSATRRHAKPQTALCAVCLYHIGTETPTTPEAMRYFKICSGSRLEIATKAEDEGKFLYFATRWHGKDDEEGVWSGIKRVVIS